jgi:hypothetical protein
VRTVLNEKQLHTLRTCYNANPRPDALMKEQLTEMTNLSPRVIRVWFQHYFVIFDLMLHVYMCLSVFSINCSNCLLKDVINTLSCCCCICFIKILRFLSLHLLFWNQTLITLGLKFVISVSCSYKQNS